MDIKWKKFSRSAATKVIAFIIVILCFSGALTIILNVFAFHQGDLGILSEESYYQGRDYIDDSSQVVQDLMAVTVTYQSEEHILQGGTVTEDEIAARENRLYNEYELDYAQRNDDLSTAEKYNQFREVYADRIAQIKGELIQEDLHEYRQTVQRLGQYQGVIYYARSGETVFTNSPEQAKDHFQSFPACLVFDSSERKVFPAEIKQNPYYYRIISEVDSLTAPDALYVAFGDEFLNPRLAEWEANKALVANGVYLTEGLLIALVAAFIYLLMVIGRRPEDEKVHLNSLDKIYNDVNLVLCFFLIALWIIMVSSFYPSFTNELIFPITLLIAVPGLALVLSLVKHIKNGTFIKHTLIYRLGYKLYQFIKDVYNSGSTAVKVILIVIFYPIIAGLTFFMLPVTIGVAAWLALKKVKEFEVIKAGVKQVKAGDLRHTIDVPGDGELAKLAADVNTITDGLNKAVDNEIKSERLKSELITNVSHDIRTPLTSIITYVDLLKNEGDQAQAREYIEIIDQKSQRLKTLTDDLFEAAKASSGNIPVDYGKIELVSLITQGLGEFDDKLQTHKLDFKINHPADKVYIEADGKLLWRAIENLLLNIFKYGLEGSRVYIDIIDAGSQAELIIKNISAYELNISADELMERFTRGDASRSSQGSGLGLSIAKSLIEIQKGSLAIEIDGDLFKVIIQMPKSALS